MIFRLSSSCGLSAPVRATADSLAQVNKKRFDFHNNRVFAGDSRLIGYRNPFARQENSSITSGLLQRRRNTTENNREMDELVTTDHLLRPNGQRRAASLLPIWLPNPTVLALKRRVLSALERGSRDYIKGKTYDAAPKRNQTKKH